MTAPGRGDGMLDIHGKCRREREELEARLAEAERRAERAEREWQIADHRMVDMLKVVEAARRFCAQFTKPVSGFPRRDALYLAVATYDATPVAASGRTSNEDVADVGATANLAVTSHGLAMHAVLSDVIEERFRQDAKWGESNHPDGTDGGEFFRTRRDFRQQATKDFAQTGQLTWRHILDEEVHKAYAEVDRTVLRQKLISTAAVAVAWAEAIDRRADSRAGQAGEEVGRG